MKIVQRLIFSEYTDRFVFHCLPPQFHAGYKLFRYGTYDSERLSMVRRAVLWLSTNEVSGPVCEFGSAGGESFLNLYFQLSKIAKPCPHSYLFDSFEGLPEIDERTPHRGWKKGDYAFSYDGFVKRMDFFGVPRVAYTATKGFFEQTLTLEKKALLGMAPVSLVHIDCDLYKSTLLALQFVQDNLQQGTVILFDDYYCCRGNLRMGESGA